MVQLSPKTAGGFAAGNPRPEASCRRVEEPEADYHLEPETRRAGYANDLAAGAADQTSAGNRIAQHHGVSLALDRAACSRPGAEAFQPAGAQAGKKTGFSPSVAGATEGAGQNRYDAGESASGGR